MQMPLEFAVTAETEPAHDAHDGCRIGFQTLCHRPQHVLARVLENRADDLLALDAEMLHPLAQVNRRRWGRTTLVFHHGERIA
jgi:hypothetical protein